MALLFLPSKLKRRVVFPLLSTSAIFLLVIFVPSFPFQSDRRNRVGDVLTESNVSTSWVHFPSEESRSRIEVNRYRGSSSTSPPIISSTQRNTRRPLYSSRTSTTSSTTSSTNTIPIFYFSESNDEVYTSNPLETITPDSNYELPPSTEYRNHILAPSGTPDCANSSHATFCESVSSYPERILRKEVKLSPIEFREFFGQISIDGRKSYADDETTEEKICRQVTKFIYPRLAKNKDNVWVYVVNDLQEYPQSVIIELCESEGEACRFIDDKLPLGEYSHCRQKYSTKKLLAIHPTEKRTYAETFRFPSCCACYIKRPSGFDIRSTLASL